MPYPFTDPNLFEIAGLEDTIHKWEGDGLEQNWWMGKVTLGALDRLRSEKRNEHAV